MNSKDISSKFEEKTQLDMFNDYSLEARASRLPEHYRSEYYSLIEEQQEAHSDFIRELEENRPAAIKRATLRELQKLNSPRLILDKENTSPASLKFDAKMRATKSVGDNYAMQLHLLKHTHEEQQKLFIENTEKQLRKTKSLKKEFNPSLKKDFGQEM